MTTRTTLLTSTAVALVLWTAPVSAQMPQKEGMPGGSATGGEGRAAHKEPGAQPKEATPVRNPRSPRARVRRRAKPRGSPAKARPNPSRNRKAPPRSSRRSPEQRAALRRSPRSQAARVKHTLSSSRRSRLAKARPPRVLQAAIACNSLSSSALTCTARS